MGLLVVAPRDNSARSYVSRTAPDAILFFRRKGVVRFLGFLGHDYNRAVALLNSHKIAYPKVERIANGFWDGNLTSHADTTDSSASLCRHASRLTNRGKLSSGFDYQSGGSSLTLRRRPEQALRSELEDGGFNHAGRFFLFPDNLL